MAPAVDKPTRKRNRKRKRRAVSSSSSSDDSSSDSDTSSSPQKTVVTLKQPVRTTTTQASPSSSEEDSSSSSSDSESVSSEVKNADARQHEMSVDDNAAVPIARHRTPTPPPVPSTIPPFAPEDMALDAQPPNDEILKTKFRKFWMGRVVDAFESDLVEIRKVNLYVSNYTFVVLRARSGA